MAGRKHTEVLREITQAMASAGATPEKLQERLNEYISKSFFDNSTKEDRNQSMLDDYEENIKHLRPRLKMNKGGASLSLIDLGETTQNDV